MAASTYSYSASKYNGRFSVTVSGDGKQIAVGEGFRTIRGVKGFAKAAALAHKRETSPSDSHGENHSLYGTFAL